MKIFFKGSNLLFFAFATILISACGKKEAPKPVEEAPKVCTNQCASWQERTDYPDCQCIRPEYTLPDAKLQAQMITAALNGNVAFLKEQIDVKHINPDAYLGLSEMDNLLSFRESVAYNKVLYNNMKRTTDNLTLAAIAATNKSLGDDLIKMLAERKVDFSKKSIDGKTPAELALKAGNSKALSVILDNGGTGNFFEGENNYLKQAIQNSATPVVKTLIKYAKDNNINISDSLPPLSQAIKQKDKEMLANLIDIAKADPMQTDENGTPAISLAALTGNKEMVNMLILGGANIEQTNPKGQTPLMVLINKADPASSTIKNMSDFLIVNGADVNATDLKGQTPLFYAVKINDQQLIKTLLEQGADINARDNKGESVLFYATANDDKKMVKFLLDNGASTKLKNKNKLDAATVAVQNGFMDTYDIIQNHK